jgi:Hydrolases of the alpha/beta superfamily
MIPHNEAVFTIIYSHGNGCDMGQSLATFMDLSARLKCNVLLYDYSGYGSSTGRASEANLYWDIEAVYHTLRLKYNINCDQIILYGQSIGSVPTVYLASRVNVAGVILHCALLSALRVVFPNFRKSLWFDGLKNIDKLPKIKSPVLVIHGTRDEIVDFSHGMTIYESCPNVVEPLWVPGAGHNNIEMFEQYLTRLDKFINEELMQRYHQRQRCTESS